VACDDRRQALGRQLIYLAIRARGVNGVAAGLHQANLVSQPLLEILGFTTIRPSD
jgi:hypothetical protein